VLFPDEAVVCGPVPLFVPYGEPGLPLGRIMLERFEAFLDEHGAPPRLVLLANHGIVALGSHPRRGRGHHRDGRQGSEHPRRDPLRGRPAFLGAAQAARLFGREDEQARLSGLAAANCDTRAETDHGR
jgi:hypothetical protein